MGVCDAKNISDKVYSILLRDSVARDNDDYLFAKVCLSISPEAAYMPFYTILLNRKQYGFPPFESVRRSRQKIQAEHPELAGSRSTSDARKEKEKAYRSWAVDNG